VYLGHLLSIQLTPEERARMSPLELETRKRYGSSIVGIVRALGASGPVVLALEDLHWADAPSIDLLLGLMPLANELPLFVVATSRFDRESEGWRLVSGVRDVFGDALVELRLDPLSGDETRTLVANLLHVESLPQATRDHILTKSEGNPFFVEEVIRMLIDRGAIERRDDRWVATARVADIEIPDTLQGLLLARIDRLPAETKRTLRVAAVIGRQFGVRMLERLLEARE
jgi:predicted ATPase